MRYINPGYAEFLDVDGGTTIENASYNPAHGVAFYQPTDGEGVDIQATVRDFYGKFDLYFPSSWGSISTSSYFLKIGIYKPRNSNAGFNGIGLFKYSNSYIHIRSLIGGSYDDSKVHTNCQVNLNGINRFYFHFKARSGDAADGEYQIYLNGTKIMEGTKKWICMDDSTKLVIYISTELFPVSNIILADSYINPKERITAVPLVAPVTDMIDRHDGSYLAESAGQQILQTVDVSSLVSEFGGSSQVTGIAVAGNPAYRTADGLTSLIGLSKAGDVQTEHGAKALRTSIAAGAIDCFDADIMLSEMTGMQLGWKAGI